MSKGGREKVKIYWEWIRDSIARNKPFDQVARERMAGQGYNGPTRHLWGADEIRLPQDVMTEQARVFLGRRLDCAQCHDHPFDSWTQDQFWGMTGFFKNLTYFWTTMAAVDDPLRHEEFGTDSRLLHPRTKQEVEAVYPDGRPLPVEARADPRPRLADWFTSSDEFLFEEAIVNRFWSYFFGRGIVDPVDDFRLTNPPSHPDLLRKLARYFRSSGYDLRGLIRLIVQSNTYQRSRRPNHTNPGDGANYSRALPRSLDAEILLDMICQITGIPEVFEGKDEREYGGRLPAGTRAMNIVNPDLHPSRFWISTGGPAGCRCRNARPEPTWPRPSTCWPARPIPASSQAREAESIACCGRWLPTGRSWRNLPGRPVAVSHAGGNTATGGDGRGAAFPKAGSGGPSLGGDRLPGVRL